MNDFRQNFQGDTQNPVASTHIPPHSLEAERSVLGALLLDSAAFSKIVDVSLDPQDFYREAHGKIFETILDLNIKSEPVDLVTLTTALKNRLYFDQIGGSAYLTGLFEESYSSAHAVYYAKIVKEKAILRRMITAGNSLVEMAYGPVVDVEEFLDEAEKKIFEVTDSQSRQSFSPIRNILVENIHALEQLAEKKSTVTGLTSGFRDLDAKTSGLHPGNLIIIAGRPAMGKTSFVLNIAERAAIRSGASIAVFSLEMAKEELGMRLLSGLAKIDATRLKTGRLQDRDWKSLTKAAATLSESKIFIDDTPAITVLEMRSRCRRLVSEHGLNLVVVDYLQLMRGNTKGGKGSDSREREISEISRSLKALAKELRCPVIALSQLNRGVESRPDKRPMLSDLRESGAIEQDADIVAFVYRDEVYNKETEDKGIAELIIAKHRAGGVGTVRLAWQPEFTAFEDLAEDFYPTQMSEPPPTDNPFAQQQPGGAYANPQFPNQGQSQQGGGQKGQSMFGGPPKKGGLDLPDF